MTVGELKQFLNNISESGYGDWIVNMCDDDDDDFIINHIYVDDDGDLCLESADGEWGTYDFTCDNVLNRINKYSDDMYIYFLEEYENESSYAYDIDDEWYIGTDDDGGYVLNIDCYPCDEDDDWEHGSCGHAAGLSKLSLGLSNTASIPNS